MFGRVGDVGHLLGGLCGLCAASVLVRRFPYWQVTNVNVSKDVLVVYWRWVSHVGGATMFHVCDLFDDWHDFAVYASEAFRDYGESRSR